MELGETVTVAGTDMLGMLITPYQGAVMAGTEYDGRRTLLYLSREDFDDSAAGLGSSVAARSVSYTIGKVERFDAPLVRLELVR